MNETLTTLTPEPDDPKSTDADPSGSRDLSVTWSHVERAGRIAGVAALTAYALGLLVVNLYLVQIGVTDFSILRTRYILTGILVSFAPILPLLGVLMTALIVEGVISGVQRARRDARRLGWLDVIVGLGILPIWTILGTLGFILFGSGITYRSSVVTLVGNPSGQFFLYFVSLLSLMVGVAAVNSGWRRVDGDWKPSALQWFALRVTIIVTAVCYLLVYIDLFASTFFPIIPEQFGGGRPKQVQIVLTEDSTVAGGAFGYISDDPPTIGDVELLWETEQMYVFRDRGQQADRIIQIDRDEVSAIVFDLGAIPSTPASATPAATPTGDP